MRTVSVQEIETARDVLEGVVKHTPIKHSRTFSRRTEADIFLKYENFQRTGSFKIRGAYNRIHHLTDRERDRGVITASAGNHAQGVSLAASEAGIDATIVMPRDAPISKVEATRGYGAEVVLDGVDYEEAYQHARHLQTEDRVFIHPFDDPLVQAGQGTIGLEVLDDLPSVDTVVVSIGGGGLIAGLARIIKDRSPDTRVIGVQAEGAASVPQSLEQGEIYERETISTISDGIATRHIAESTFQVIRECVDDVCVVSEDETANAILHLLERDKTVVEGAGAVTLAAVLSNDLNLSGESVLCLLSGGNIDSNVLSQIINRGLVYTGRYLKFETVLKDKPGALVDIASRIAELNANVYAIHHDRMAKDISLNAAEVVFELETRNSEHAREVVQSLEEEGYDIRVKE